MSILWRPLPVMTLTIRQFMGGRSVRVVTALGFLPCLFALIFLLNRHILRPEQFLRNRILDGLFFPTLLPVTVLILATGALGNEIEDRTLPYLTLKPLSRIRIVVEKWLGCVTVALPAILAGLLTACVIVLRGDFGSQQRLVVGALLATVVGICAYAAIFLLVSLIIQRALLVGIIYTFVWESVLGRYLPGLREVSVQYYVTSIFQRYQDNPRFISDGAAQLSSAVITLAVTSAVALFLASWRLRRMSLD